MADGPTREEWTQLNQAAVASGLGCSIVASIVVTIGGGIVLDRALDTTPVLTLIGVALGLLAAGYQLYELAQMGHKDRRPPPITRGLAKLSAARKSARRGPGPEAGDSSADRTRNGPGAG